MLHCRRPVHVERRHQHAFAVLFLQALGQFGSGCCLTAPLKTDHQDWRRRIVDLERARFPFAFQHVDQRVMHDLDDLLTRRDGFRHRLSGRFFLHRFHEVARHGQRDVRLKQRDAHLAQGGFHVLLGQRTLLGQAVKNAGQAFGQIFKHGPWPPSCRLRSSLLGRNPAFNAQTPPWAQRADGGRSRYAGTGRSMLPDVEGALSATDAPVKRHQAQ